MQALTYYSVAPILRDVQIEYSTKEFNGSFFKEDIYRQPGSPEVDAAWEALGVDCKIEWHSSRRFMLMNNIDRAGVISKEDGLASGLKPSFVQRSERYGGGFLVNVEGMHHLHCLVCLTLPNVF